MDIPEDQVCVICKKPMGSLSKVTLAEKGSATINRVSKERNETLQCMPGDQVHQECRRKYCAPNQIAKDLKQNVLQPTSSSQRVLRSAEPEFNFSTNCFYCGKPAILGRKRKVSDVISVRTVETRDTILGVCQKMGDDWGNVVQARITQVHDLPAADAVYHAVCSTNFRTMKQIPASHDQSSSKRVKVGRPPEEQRMNAFLEVAKFLEENDDEQISIQDLIQRMDKNLANTEFSAYSYHHMQEKLKEHFGNKIIQTEINGKPNVVTFRSKAKKVLCEFYSQRNFDSEKDKLRIIETAAKLIKDDIKAVKTSHCYYPGIDELELKASIDFLPKSLTVLLTNLLFQKVEQVKIASIGQAIMQASHPRVFMAPLQFGLGVQLHHHYASRFLIDTLHKYGFCCSYNEVHQFEQNAALSYGTDIPNFSSQFIQYVADNVDHNIRTLDGNNTFHGMGMIAAVTPKIKGTNQIPRLNIFPADIAATGRVPIQFHRDESFGMAMVTYEKLRRFISNDSTVNFDVLWKCSVMFGSP